VKSASTATRTFKWGASCASRGDADSVDLRRRQVVCAYGRPRTISAATPQLAAFFVENPAHRGSAGGSAGGLWWRWEPWAPTWISTTYSDALIFPHFSPDGRKLLTRNGSSTRVFDTETWQELASLDGMAFRPEFSRDGSLFLLHADHETLMYDTATLSVLKRFPHDAWQARFSPSGNVLATLGGGGQTLPVLIDFWTVQSGELISSVHENEPVQDLKFIDDDHASTVLEYDVPSGKVLDIKEGSTSTSLVAPPNLNFNHPDFVPETASVRAAGHFASYSHSGMLMAVVWGDNTVHVYARRRPDDWWGIAWLPEFWLSALCSIALLWSLRRDWKPRIL
jgi:hypothetical protein